MQPVLDSWAVIAGWWKRAPGSAVVAHVDDADHVLMSWTTSELLYRETRRSGDPRSTAARVKRFAGTIHVEAPYAERVIAAAL